MKRARRAQNQKPNFSRRLAVSAFGLIRHGLLKAGAIAASRRLFSAHKRCDLMILPRFDLLTRMGKSISKRKAVAAALSANDEESARGRLLNAATRLFCKNGINATGID